MTIIIPEALGFREHPGAGVLIEDLSACGIGGALAFATLDENLGIQVVVDHRLDAETRDAVVSLALAQLAAAIPDVVLAGDVRPGGAA